MVFVTEIGGISDISIGWTIAILCALFATLCFVATYLMNKGIGLKY